MSTSILWRSIKCPTQTWTLWIQLLEYDFETNLLILVIFLNILLSFIFYLEASRTLSQILKQCFCPGLEKERWKLINSPNNSWFYLCTDWLFLKSGQLPDYPTRFWNNPFILLFQMKVDKFPTFMDFSTTRFYFRLVHIVITCLLRNCM